MANQPTLNPAILDTQSSANGISPRTHVIGMSWTGSAAGNQCIVKDLASNIIWEATATAEKLSFNISYNPVVYDNGIFAHTLDSGNLLIYKPIT